MRFLYTIPRSPIFTLFPYTTLFRSRIFEKRLELTSKLTNEPFNQIEDLQAYREELLNVLHQQVSNLNEQSIQVRPHLKLVEFVRCVSGLEREAVVKEFDQFLQDNQLSSIQIQFIEQMIEFYTEKGHLKVANLYEPPFNFIDEDGVEGAFANKTKVIELLV